MAKLDKLFTILQNFTSNKDKEAFVKLHKNNTNFLELLDINLNPFRQFYIKKLPKRDKINYTLSGKENYEKFVVLVKKLESREVTGNAALDEVKTFFENSYLDEAKMYEKILLKKAIGVGPKTVNKALGYKYIPEFDVMLAPNKIANVTSVDYPLIVQPKLDGFRCICLSGDSVKLLSRSGKPLVNKQLRSHFKALERAHGYALDGELYDPTITFQKLDSILTTEDKELPETLKYYIFDCIPLDDWEAKSCSLTYESRLKLTRRIVTSHICNYKRIVDVGSDIAEYSSDVVSIYKKYLKEGYEGVMLKASKGLYRWKRVTLKSGEMLKLKPFDTLDLPIVGFYDGEDKYTGLLGGIVVKYKDKEVRVGSGFSDKQRKDINENRDLYLGKTAEVKYLEETDGGSLRHPIFLRVRNDK